MANPKPNKAPMKFQGKTNTWRHGHLHFIDDIPPGDPLLGSAIATFTNATNEDRQSRHWVRAVQWMENILFAIGRHYVDDLLVTRLSRDSNANLSVVNEATRSIPKPVNDLLGRYIETNIALLTENRPRPRVSAKSNRSEDLDAAELSELTLEYLWEAMDMPEMHREIARLLLLCGVCWMDISWDPTRPRRLTVPQTEEAPTSNIPVPGGQSVNIPVPRQVPVVRDGRLVFDQRTEFGDISARVVSPFELHVPVGHWWNDDDNLSWIIREFYISKDRLIDKYKAAGLKLNKRDGWYLKNLEEIGTQNIKNLPLWWWERLADVVEGPGPSIYVGTPEQWEGYTVCRWFDRKPNPKWPKGRSVLVCGNQVIYDSPKNIGARAYNPRWPTRWHPYVRFRWEGIPGSIYGRSMVSKLLPKLKRVNAIDTTLIMWRRTVPIATWVAPKGSHPIEDLWYGRPGGIWEYDPRRTVGHRPEPVFAPDYPKTALEERSTQIAEMESIAGTEEVLRGQRPTGVNSAAMIDILRKQALASRSPALQAWDESLQLEGTYLLQEVIKHVSNDPRYAERIRVLAREKKSWLSVRTFSGSDLSDNVVVRVDTASMALVSKEARQAKALEFMQYAPGLISLPGPLREAILEEMDFAKGLKPHGPDIDRAKRLLAYIRQGDFERVIPFPEDDPYIFHDVLVQEQKSEAFWDLNEEQQNLIIGLINVYKQMIQFREEQALRLQQMMGGPAGGGNGQGGAPPGAPVQ